MEWFGMFTAFFAMLATLFTAYATYKIVSTMNILHDRDRENDIRTQKIHAFYQLLGNRHLQIRSEVAEAHVLSEQRFFEALNACTLVFSDSKDIMKALDEYHNNPNPDNFYKFCKSIATELNINLDKHSFLHPFYPKRLLMSKKQDTE